MIAETALTIWANACEKTDIRWFLYKETLLCAHGYHHFPASVSCAQIAVFAKDLPKLAEQVFPVLPDDWVLNKTCLVGNNRMLVFDCHNEPALEIGVLYGIEDETQIGAFTDKVKQIVRKVKKKQNYHGLFGKLLGGVYTGTVGKLAWRQICKLAEKTFAQLVALAGTSREDAAFYCDSMTNKKPVLLSGKALASTAMLTCDGVQYPVFSDCREYLTKVFGDYEAGLVDAVGCGLTAEEKELLKEHQGKCFEALTFLQEVSREFGLRYYLLAGSVLGAVRHGGFIPWDDDIDVGIRIEELENFERIVKEQLPARLSEDFELMQSGANNPYPRMFSKICYKGRCCIDLWPLVPTYNEGLRAKFLWYFAKLITKVHYKKIGYKVTKFRKLVNILSAFLTDKMTMTMARNNERKYAGKETPAYINLYSIYRRPKETIQRTWLDEEKTAVFNGLEVPVVGCTEAYLTHMYGDYMAYPPPWKRASRHYENFAIYKK